MATANHSACGTTRDGSITPGAGCGTYFHHNHLVTHPTDRSVFVCQLCAARARRKGR